jgi:hypothetical protein
MRPTICSPTVRRRLLGLALVPWLHACDLENAEETPVEASDASTDVGPVDTPDKGNGGGGGVAPPDAGPAKKDQGLASDGAVVGPDSAIPKPDAGVAPDASPPVGEPFDEYGGGSDGPPLPLALPRVQPARFDRNAVCAGQTVTLHPAEGSTFEPQTPDVRVLFAPCGIPGEVVEWRADAITVIVPPEAETGAVWLAGGIDAELDKAISGAKNCVASVLAGTYVPERPVTYCDASVPDPFDPRLASKRRGVPVPPADAEGGAPAQTSTPLERAADPEDPEVPRCIPGVPARRPPLALDVGERADLTIVQAGGDRIGCFESCEAPLVGGPEAPSNVLRVETPPRIERFLPAVGEIDAQGRHRVERGPLRLDWSLRAEELEEIRLERWQEAPEFVAPDGTLEREALFPTQATLTARNACGETARVLDITPVTTLRVEPTELVVAPEGSAEARIRIDWPIDRDVDIALDDASGGMLRLDRRVVTLPAGATEAVFTVARAARAAGMPDGASLGTIDVRVADPMHPLAESVVDALSPVQVRGGGGVAGPPVPGPGQVLVRGTLRYRECMGRHADGFFSPIIRGPADEALTLDADGCVLANGAPFYRPIRRARVEVWDQAPIIDQQRAVVETDDAGVFLALVPADGEYDVTVVASSFAGHVGFENDVVTWFWRALRRPQRGAGGSTLTFDHAFERAEARHFNVLDGITRGLQYAAERSGVETAELDRTFRKTVAIPGSWSGGTTLRVGHATHIWLGAWNQVFMDEVVLHEYGHHMQHANGTYQVWGTIHQGCYATVVAGPACAGRFREPGVRDEAFDAGCWVNSNELAWFEGFPEYFSATVMDFDGARALTPTDIAQFRYAPGPRFCPLVENPHWNHRNVRITGAAAEDYVAGALRTLLGRNDIADAGGVLTRDGLERALFQVFTRDIRDRAATIYHFRDAWNARFPGNSALAEIMSGFSM